MPQARKPPTIVLVKGDITEQQVDAIVNAANPTLLGGGGVDGAIHRRGGPAILEECRRLRATCYPDGLPVGKAVATTAGRLPARWVIHTVGPVYSPREDRSAQLAACFRSALGVADELGARTVAFPAISTGAYGYPVEEAARVAIRAVRETPTAVEEVRFVLFDDRAYRAFEQALAEA
jgi:O-acetyl-ADP-ribose deacetylase (regulator of RNase III)